jgi:nucleotide-binding universal stress UspA family protein
MTQVVVPVRYPLSPHSRATLGTAIDVAAEHDAALTVLHVDLYHAGERVSQAELKRAVEREFGSLSDARYVVRDGLLVEETILEEVVSQGADVVVIGEKQTGRWRRMVRRLVDDPDVARYLREKLDCEVVTASVPT